MFANIASLSTIFLLVNIFNNHKVFADNSEACARASIQCRKDCDDPNNPGKTKLWKWQTGDCQSNDPFGFMSPEMQKVERCVVPVGCTCIVDGVQCEEYDCNRCWTSTSSPGTLRWLACCAYDCPGQCGPDGAIAGCRDTCIEKSDPACRNSDCGRDGGICNSVKCYSEVEACTELVVPCETTAPPGPTPAPDVCDVCSNGFGLAGTEKWCNCCKNDCSDSRAACIANDGWCDTRCTQYDGVCPMPTPAPPSTSASTTTTATGAPTPVPTTGQPTPQATMAPTPMPTKAEVFRSCIEPEPGLRILWSRYGIKPLEEVRFRLESPTSGWIGIGLRDELCAAGNGGECMSGANFVVAERVNGAWRINSYALSSGTSSGQPTPFVHGVVTGVSGMQLVQGAPAVPRTLAVFGRKMQSTPQVVRIKADPSQGSTVQTLLYAWGADGNATFGYHGANRGTVNIDWSLEVEECGRGPQDTLPITPQPPGTGPVNCALECDKAYAVGSMNWCRCCAGDCDDSLDACRAQNGFCDTTHSSGGRCLGGFPSYCELANITRISSTTAGTSAPGGTTSSDVSTTSPASSTSSSSSTASSTASSTGDGSNTAPAIVEAPIVDTPSPDITLFIYIGAAGGGCIICLLLCIGVFVWYRNRSDDAEAYSERSLDMANLDVDPNLPSVDSPEVQQFFVAPPEHHHHHHGGTLNRSNTLATLPPPPGAGGAAYDDVAAPPPSRPAMARTETLYGLPPPGVTTAPTSVRAQLNRSETLRGLPPAGPPPPGGINRHDTLRSLPRHQPPPPAYDNDVAPPPAFFPVSPRASSGVRRTSNTGTLGRRPPPPPADAPASNINTSGLLARPAGANRPPPPPTNFDLPTFPPPRELGQPRTLSPRSQW